MWMLILLLALVRGYEIGDNRRVRFDVQKNYVFSGDGGNPYVETDLRPIFREQCVKG